MVKEIVDSTSQSMKKGVVALQHAFSKVRTGRASIGILDGIMVDYYGSLTPLNQVASLSAPEPRLLTVQPWDKGALSSIEKAIFKSELGLTPSNDGNLIRIAIPPLNEERRRELVKQVKKTAEEFKIEMRNYRRDANAMIRELEKEKEIAQDECKKALDEVQEITDRFIKKIDELVVIKEKEIMEV